MKTKLLVCFAIGLGTIAFTASADVLELKDGKVLKGSYVGGSAGVIRFQTSDGVQAIETSQAVALSFTGSGGSTAAAAPAAAAPAAAPKSVSVPSGTTLVVRMMDGASSNDAKGKRFTTTLETDLVIQGQVVAKAGTRIYGRVENSEKAGRYRGKSTLDLRLTDLTVGSALVPITTGSYQQTGAGSLGKTARGAAAGAAIGAIADDEDGAAKGAAIGAVASGAKKGQAVIISSGTLLQFQLQQPVTVTVS